MTYPETLDYLYQQLPMFSRVGSSAIRKGLRNIRALCEFLGEPQDGLRCIHVAGTNGKGSVSHMLAAVLQSAGYRTGLYTSPHLSDFRERIRVDGRMVEESFVTSFTERIKPMIEEIGPSFYEITVAMAFQCYREQRVDVAVIETGLGGRLDSTNIVTPEVSVVTNIGWDHMQILGDTLIEIAVEKAGIVKSGVPVVVGEWDAETATVFEKTSQAREAPLRFADRVAEVVSAHEDFPFLDVKVKRQGEEPERGYLLELPGIYQTKNLLTVLATVDVLREKGWRIDESAVEAGLRRTRELTGLQGRWETLRLSPRVVLDVAHNEPGIRQLLLQLRSTPHASLRIVIGMVRDKDVSAVLKLLPRDADYLFTRADVPRAMPVDELALKAAEAGLRGRIYPDVNSALQAALDESSPDDLVLVCGSVFLVGEVDRGRVAGN
jgi:dihydrofolate synthase/folylpolyglutamate synthase